MTYGYPMIDLARAVDADRHAAVSGTMSCAGGSPHRVRRAVGRSLVRLGYLFLPDGEVRGATPPHNSIA